MMDLTNIQAIMRKELRDVRRSRWLVLIAVSFTVLALTLSLLGMSGLGRFGMAGFGRTTASLVNLVILLVPLMGLLLGALSIAGEREQGSLLFLLAQPVTPAEVFFGKLAGLALALSAAVLVGFGISGAVIARSAGWHQAGGYVALAGLTLVLGLVHLAIGLWLSVASRRYATALGLAIVVWLAVVWLSDLGVLGTAMILKLTSGQVLWLSLANPAQAFKLAVLQTARGHLESLGAAGMYATSVLGGWLMPLLMALLLIWIAVPLAIGLITFQRRGVG